ncbi:unnamed protein product [Aureobasidium mustum]|uniref:Uncharacterized protein n=1 Tax=Aureobasidium mustum TaxID=2773714 RepID=A0A9N8PMC6_9PEZI|nr:unnamed protein product [Aureobasidium mustum]
MLTTSDHISGQDLITSMKTILSLVFSILASIGAAALRALTELWDELFGVRPLYSVYIGSTDAIILGELIQGIKTFILPPKKLEWWETDEFHAAMGLLVLLLATWSLKCFLYRRR